MGTTSSWRGLVELSESPLLVVLVGPSVLPPRRPELPGGLETSRLVGYRTDLSFGPSEMSDSFKVNRQVGKSDEGGVDKEQAESSACPHLSNLPVYATHNPFCRMLMDGETRLRKPRKPKQAVASERAARLSSVLQTTQAQVGRPSGKISRQRRMKGIGVMTVAPTGLNADDLHPLQVLCPTALPLPQRRRPLTVSASEMAVNRLSPCRPEFAEHQHQHAT